MARYLETSRFKSLLIITGFLWFYTAHKEISRGLIMQHAMAALTLSKFTTSLAFMAQLSCSPSLHLLISVSGYSFINLFSCSDGCNNCRLDVLTAAVMKSSLSWDIAPCSPLKVNRRFVGTYHHHLHVCCLLHVGFLLGLFFKPEDGSNIIIRNVG
jgi:hypothetical protein